MQRVHAGLEAPWHRAGGVVVMRVVQLLLTAGAAGAPGTGTSRQAGRQSLLLNGSRCGGISSSSCRGRWKRVHKQQRCQGSS